VPSFYRKNFVSGYPDSLLRLEEFLGLVTNPLISYEDIVFLYSIVFSKKPLNILEIGRFEGSSTLVLAGALADNGIGQLYSIDIQDLLTSEIKNVVSNNTILITDDSRNLTSNQQLRDLNFQIFFIDGDHSTNMVINDISHCLNLSDTESIILCHDVSMPEVYEGIHQLLSTTPTLINCGRVGSDIQMLIYRKP
jgi:predicted O-methyltransferase YrrM